MRSYTDTVLVLATRPFAEADRVAVLLGSECGRVDGLVKGVRRTKSSFGARLEPFSHVRVQCHKGRTFHYVTQAQGIAAYGPRIAEDYASYSYATAVAEVTARLTDEDLSAAGSHYRLTLGAFAALASRTRLPEAVLAAYLFRAMGIAGWQVSLNHCADCGMPGPHRYFDVRAGGSLCVRCRTPMAGAVPGSVVTTGAAAVAGDWSEPATRDEVAAREAARLAASYVLWHTDSRIRSLAGMFDPPSAVGASESADAKEPAL